MTKRNKKELSPEQHEELLIALKARFEKNMNRHKGLEWAKVQAKLEANTEKLWSLNEMESTGGEPDVVGHDKKTGEYIFYDCSAESPKGRRSVCYDPEALESRKEHEPKDSAVGMAAAMGIEVLTEEQYRELQKLGNFDAKTSSWLKTPSDIRELGGAIVGDFRYGHVFVGHNGAESYYASRGFRGSLRVSGSRAVMSYPIIHLGRDCGAVGDGRADDTTAFQKAATLLERAGGGTLVIPQGTFVVGRQVHVAGQYPYYKAQPIFTVTGLRSLHVVGNGAKIRIAAGLRYGSFDKDTGAPYSPAMPFTDYDYRVDIGAVLSLAQCSDVVISNLEIDGNLSELVLGGLWGDVGRQVLATGILLERCTNVHITGVHAHHHALDGICVGWGGLVESAAPTPHMLTDCTFAHNGRQGLSWVGGRGLVARRCKFNHTQRGTNQGAPLASPPGAGVDIEAENSICRDGHFEDCEFIDNGGPGMVADSGDGGHSTFLRCTFWGTSNWSVWSARPGLKYQQCTFHGSAVHTFGSPESALATTFTECHFDDKGGRVYGKFLVETDEGGQGVTFDRCTFTASTRKSLWFGGGSGGGSFVGCKFVHAWDGAPPEDFLCLIRGAEVHGCHFEERFAAGARGPWYIAVGNTVVAGTKSTCVDGPLVKWQNWSWGATGIVPPGTYTS